MTSESILYALVQAAMQGNATAQTIIALWCIGLAIALGMVAIGAFLVSRGR